MRIIVPFVFSFLLFSSALTALGQAPTHVFHPLSVEDGLSEGTVRSITEDIRGFMWFGTEDGLNKYDGYEFTVYKPDLNDTFSITNKFIKCFFNDSHGNLWVGTKEGINIYDHRLDRFYNFKSDHYPALQYIKDEIEEIREDKKGHLLIATAQGLYKITSMIKEPQRLSASFKPHGYLSLAEDTMGDFYIGTRKGLIKFHPATNQFEDLSELDGYSYIRDMYLDSLNNLWLATVEGLKYIDITAKSLKQYDHNPADNNSINGNNIVSVIPEKRGFLVAIDGSGLDFFDPEHEKFYHYTKETRSQLNSNNITSIYKDSKGTLWAGTYMNGINFSNVTTNFLVWVKNNSSSGKGLKSGIITGFLKDSRGTFWITTDGGGVFFRKKGSEHFLSYNTRSPQSVLRSNATICVLEDQEKNIWISTYAGGLTRIAPDGKVKIFTHDSKDSSSLAWDKVNALIEYNNEIWVSTYGMGISVYNKKTGKFRQYRSDRSDPASLPSDWTNYFLEDSKGTLWIASYKGFCKYLPEENRFRTYPFNQESKAVDEHYVLDIYEDSDRNLWLGTNGGGLVFFDPNKETFRIYTTSDGLTANVVKAIIEDNNRQLWLATNNGLTRFSLDKRKGVTYTIHDGLPSASFSYHAKYKDEEGKIYFGANDGYVVIDPALSKETVVFPPVVLTGFKIFNVPVTPNAKNSFLKTHISEAKKITLPYDQNSLSLKFASLNFSIPKQNYYSYKLEGFDKGWNYTGKSREAKYTNLDPGKYTFKVRASNHEKSWNEKSTGFSIIITPPFWKTWWFRLMSSGAMVFFVISFIYIRTRRIRLRNLWLQNQVRERTLKLQETNIALKEQTETVLEQRKELLDKKYMLEKNNEKLAEYNEFQQKLIGIIGHDMRGPLQRFSALLNVMDETSPDSLQKLKENARSLSLLATDLLDWVSFQASKTEMDKEVFSWKDVWDKALKEIEPFREEKKVSVSVTHHKTGEHICGAVSIALASLRNILSNALRFSETGGMIEVETGILKGNYAGIRITDYGKGFDAVEVNKLIGGEGLSGMRSAPLQGGAGLGMTICNDMMKRCNGYIEAASFPGSGATFFIYLPVADQPDGKAKFIEKETVTIEEDRLNLIKDKKILLVDDDDELRWSLVKFLGKYLTVHEARSGEEALERIKENAPDLVLLDIRMSGISGIEVCRKLKGSGDTAHIPCLVISGETGENTRKEVFNAGADSFLPKPLSSEEVLIQITTYFENHKKLIKRFFSENLPVESLSQNEFNKEFLRKVVDLIEENLHSPDLTVEFLARETGLSKSTFYRKLKNLIPLSPNTLIKNIRMRKSLILLKEGKLNISEVSSELGFNHVSYFTTTFKKHFGFSPTQLKEKDRPTG